MKKNYAVVLTITSALMLSLKLYAASSASYYLETQVNVSKLDRSQLMAIGATLPGKVYRVTEDKTCIISLSAVTKITQSKGWLFSSSETEVATLPPEFRDTREQAVNDILSLTKIHPELFQEMMDSNKNISLSSVASLSDKNVAERARALMQILDSNCN